MKIKSIKTFIVFILAFIGANSLFIKMSNIKALVIAIILYFFSYIFLLTKR
jgi:type IV secretory pathway VirB3-like protein